MQAALFSWVVSDPVTALTALFILGSAAIATPFAVYCVWFTSERRYR